MCGMLNRPRKTTNDIGTYLVVLKIGTNIVLIGDALNERFLKSHSHFPEKLIFIAWIKSLKNDKKYFLFHLESLFH